MTERCLANWGRFSAVFSYYYSILSKDPTRLPQATVLSLVGGLFFLLLLEQLIPLRADWKKSGDKTIITDVLHQLAAASANVLANLIFPIALLATADHVGLDEMLGWWPDHLPYALHILILVFLADGVEYWLHRGTHLNPWLWSLHVVHHTPTRLPHSLDLKQGNSNFALVFPLWDVIFGTFSDPAKETTVAVGVPSPPTPVGFIHDLLRPFYWKDGLASTRKKELLQKKS